MKARPYFPLLAKVLAWLLLHLMVLVLVFFLFLRWQLGLGLESLLSGSAGDRLRSFGEAAREEMIPLNRQRWNAGIEPLAREKKVVAGIFDFKNPKNFPVRVPPNVLERALTAQPPLPRRGPPLRRLGDREPAQNGPPPRADEEPPAPRKAPLTRPVFLLRGDGGDGYWAGIRLTMPGPFGLRPERDHLLLVRAEHLDGSGMFFDFKPWLWGGLAVLGLSLAFWTPFVWGITRYLRRLTSATDRMAAGDFKISLPERGNDELGNLGTAITSMAVRLDHLITGQKRFLGDAAHELCAPLARLRTGLGILEMKLGNEDQPRLSSIDSDAQELATLVEEILAFSRAGSRPPRCESVLLEPLVREIIARESNSLSPEILIPSGLAAYADAKLLGRSIANLIRNAYVHAGPQAKVIVQAVEVGESVFVTVSDDGPGVSAHELERLFEPFYRPDRSRSRDTGGSGLGLAIVRSAMEACGGEASATSPAAGGFSVILRLRRNLPIES
jgi:two-component system, OmpR family, sensor histidine kinase CpxA